MSNPEVTLRSDLKFSLERANYTTTDYRSLAPTLRGWHQSKLDAMGKSGGERAQFFVPARGRQTASSLQYIHDHVRFCQSRPLFPPFCILTPFNRDHLTSNSVVPLGNPELRATKLVNDFRVRAHKKQAQIALKNKQLND